MNRAHFMAQLRDGLSGLHHTDIDDIVADYERHFADGAADGRSEDEVAAALGDPQRLARELRAEVGFKRWEQNRNAGNFLGVVLALLGLATIDLVFLLPILCAISAVCLGAGGALEGRDFGRNFDIGAMFDNDRPRCENGGGYPINRTLDWDGSDHAGIAIPGQATYAPGNDDKLHVSGNPVLVPH